MPDGVGVIGGLGREGGQSGCSHSVPRARGMAWNLQSTAELAQCTACEAARYLVSRLRVDRVDLPLGMHAVFEQPHCKATPTNAHPAAIQQQRSPFVLT